MVTLASVLFFETTRGLSAAGRQAMPQVNHRALVAEDNELVLAGLVRALAEAGLSCDSAADGDEAQRMLAKSRYDLLVTDLRMPKCHGHCLVLNVLSQKDPPAVIVVSGYLDPPVARDLTVRGVKELFEKPVDFFQVARTAQRLLGLPPTPKPLSSARTTCRERPRSASEEPSNRTTSSRLARIENSLRSVSNRLPSNLLSQLRGTPTCDLPSPPDRIGEFLSRFTVPSPFAFSNRRSEPRLELTFGVVAIALNEKLERVDGPLIMYTRDISASAVGLIATRPVETEHMAIGWTSHDADSLWTIVRVIRSRSYRTLHDVTGVFVKDLVTNQLGYVASTAVNNSRDRRETPIGSLDSANP